MKKIIFLLTLTLIPLNAVALELLLEENRGESGTIGYVDIDRVFKEYSGTTGAREEFIAEIKKKEDVLNARKTPVFTLKAELAKLRQEREFALTLPSLLETQRSVAEAAAATAAAAAAAKAAALAAAQDAAKAAQDAEAAALAAALAVQASTDAVQVSTEVVQVHPVLQVSTAAPQVSTAAPQALPPAAASLPGMGGLLKEPASSGINMPGVAMVPVTHFKFSISTSVPEIDAALSKKEAELAAKEEDLRLFQRQTERELLEYESRKSEILLGRIYVALKELAIKEEVSVIIDKRSILFGQKAVDLTGKLLKRLEEGGI
ncbi:MAG: OmpH family outer membrane protein [Elusimicrobiota bacterium]|nr:OmpH family outer membrane protein [Elusimicrobiota bacterium]